MCWGLDEDGQATPPEDERFVAISSGRAHSCGLRDDGIVACWGDLEERVTIPPYIERFVSIRGGTGYSCGLRQDGTPVCWGEGNLVAPRGEQFVSIAIGPVHTCGLRHDGRPVCWGDGYDTPTETARRSPLEAIRNQNAIAITSGYRLQVDAGSGCVSPTKDAIAEEAYPLVIGPLYLYVNKSSLERPEVRAFAEFYMHHAF